MYKLKIKKFFTLVFVLCFMFCFTSSVFAEENSYNGRLDGRVSGVKIGSSEKTSGSLSTAGSEDTKAAETLGAGVDVTFKNQEQTDALNLALDDFFSKIRWLISVISVFGCISSFLIFSISWVRLAVIPSHPMERRKVLIDIMQSGIATVGLGGLSLVMTIFYKTFAGFINNNVFLIGDYKIAFSMALSEYRYLVCGIMGVLALTMLAIFIKDCIALAASGGNPQEREKAMKGILITLIATAGFGGTGILVAIFTGVLAV